MDEKPKTVECPKCGNDMLLSLKTIEGSLKMGIELECGCGHKFIKGATLEGK